jgi:hypothetical protein
MRVLLAVLVPAAVVVGGGAGIVVKSLRGRVRRVGERKGVGKEAR